jgi:hypothetical protein
VHEDQVQGEHVPAQQPQATHVPVPPQAAPVPKQLKAADVPEQVPQTRLPQAQQARGKRSVAWTKIVVSLVIVGAFCIVPSLLLLQNVDNSAGMLQLKSLTTLGSPADNYYGPPAEVYSDRSSLICVAFEFLGLDPATSLAKFGIVVGLAPDGAATAARWLKSGSTVMLQITSNVGLSSITIPVPASALQPSGSTQQMSSCNNGPKNAYIRAPGYRTLQDIFVLGQSRAFPNDWYELDDDVTAYLCAGKQGTSECGVAQNGVPSNGTVSLSHATAEPASVIMTTDDQDLTTNVETGEAGGQKDSVRLAFVIRRAPLVVWYTYVVGVMPFVLIIGLAMAFMRKKRVYGVENRSPAVHEIAFGLAAALVTILPLRTVLVPSSLPSLTRLDIVFSMGVAVLVGLTLAWVIVWTKPTDGKVTPAGGQG